jgi:mRNA-degrading endonuclease RelE of RelBE toxin-antitoxin system
VVFHEEILETGEYGSVPRDKLRQAVDRIKDNPEAGKPLVRELKGCRSVRVGGSENRLVYRVLGPDLVEVLAIERRRDNEVYDLAPRRL